MRNLLRVDSLKEAVRKDGLFLAGGTEILRLNTGVDENADLIDILPLLDKEIREEGDDVIIGSGVTFSDLLSSDIVPEYVKKAALYMCSAELRNQATIGGNIASWRDDSYLIPSLAAASARLLVLEKDGKLKTVEEGSVTQLACKSAYAVTYHKAQGLTLDAVYMDVSGWMAPHSIYLGLSRLKSIDGLGLSRPLKASDIRIDKEAIRFFSSDRDVVQEIRNENVF